MIQSRCSQTNFRTINFQQNFTSSKAAMLHYTNGTIMPSKQIFSTLLNLSIFVT